MPVITVYGIPHDANNLRLNAYIRPGLKKAIADVSELGISPKDVSVFFHKENFEDSGFEDSQRDVVIFVDGLFERPERTDEALNAVARALVGKMRECDLVRRSKIECFVRTVDPARGFCST